MRNEDRDDLDRVLDTALASYSGREPWPGLEDRVVRRIRCARVRRPRWWMALPAAAALVMVVIAIWLGGDRRMAPERIERPLEIAVSPKEPLPLRAPAPRAQRPKRAARPAVPKRERFPTPAPLTTSELAVLSLVRRDPREAQELLAAARRPGIEPIIIEEIQIAPLEN
jgi:hypothetical protein